MEPYKLLKKAYRLMNLYNTQSKKPYTYAEGMTLYPAQSHMIEIIGDSEGITLTEIAAEYRITKGAVSQIVRFLCDKGLVIKKAAGTGGRRTGLYLSDPGRRIREEHRERHREMVEKVSAMMERLPPDTLVILSDVADVIEENIINL